MTNSQYAECTCLLRKALLANALFSTLSGLTVLVAQRWVSRILGLSNDANLWILGVVLIVFAVSLTFNARRQNVKMSDAWVAVSMDLAWVVGSAVLIFVVPFSTVGQWVVILVAETVLVFALFQFLGIRRIQKSKRFG